MQRDIYKKLIEWKQSVDRKPLIIDGARQVGKTWILKEFGKNEFSNTVYINCDRTVEMKSLFYDFDTERLLRAFSSISNQVIEPGKTLIVLDEIQESPLAITALKYFCEDVPDYHIIAAGSLLGISLHSGTGFPVGKVDEMKMFPMSFSEFIRASGNELLLEFLQSHRWSEIAPLAPRFIDLLRQYYYVGGMPEVVQCYFDSKNILKVRELQKRILRDYEQDFAKHVPAGILSKVSIVWNSIPSQLAKENKKFIYGALSKGARAKEYEDAIEWLIKAGLIHKVVRTSKIEKHLKFYEDIKAFKLFMCDLGLLGAMADVSAREILTGQNYFSEYKGAFTEQYAAQELIAQNRKLFYYSKENSTLEIDFLVQTDQLFVIEIKAETNLKSKSLSTVYKANPNIAACRFSMADYQQQDWMVNVPLYAMAEWFVAEDSYSI